MAGSSARSRALTLARELMISSRDSRVALYVVPTDEELMIAQSHFGTAHRLYL